MPGTVIEAFSVVKLRIIWLFRLIPEVICSSVGCVLPTNDCGGGVSLRLNRFGREAQPGKQRHKIRTDTIMEAAFIFYLAFFILPVG